MAPSTCGLLFKVTLPTRIPMSYSVRVDRASREPHADSIRSLNTLRYQPTDEVAKIFARDNGSITFVLLFDRMKVFRRFSSILTYKGVKKFLPPM